MPDDRPPSPRSQFFVRRILPPLARGLIRVLDWTWRYRETGRQHLDAAMAGGSQVLLGVLHGRLFPLVRPIARLGNGEWITMASKSGDGDAITGVLVGFGFEVVRGSSARGGAGAALGMIRRMRRSTACGGALIVDGSRGPRGRVQAGIVQIARKTGARIVPMTAAARPAWIFRKAWDRSLLPKPFARVDVVYGESIAVPPKLDGPGVESLAKELEERLVELQAEADRLSGFGDEEPVRAPV